MSLISSKKDIFNSINSIKSFGENNREIKTNDSLFSISNKKDPLSFLLDIATVVMGGYGLFKILGSIFSKTYDNSIPILNNQLMNTTISPFSDKTISQTNFNEIILPVKNIDVNNKLKTDPNNDIGKLIYGENDVNSFDYKLYQTINNPNTPLEINNIIAEYNDINDELIIKPLNDQQIVNDFYEEYIYENNSTNKNEFITNIFDNLFGLNNDNINKNQIINKLKTKKKIEKIVYDESNELSVDEINNIEEKSESILNGFVEYNWGCGIFKTSLDIDVLSNSIKNMNTNPDNNSIGNELENIFNNTYDSDNNTDSAKDKYNKDLINGFQLELINSFILTPKTIILNNIISKLNNNTINTNIDEYINENRKTIECISEKAKNEINSEIFNIVKSELNGLIKPFMKRIVKEKITQYSGILKSLAGF